MGQLVLKQLQMQVSTTVNGIEMGVLPDGTAYLTGRALSKLCGVRNSSISEATSDWASNAAGKRTTRLARWLEVQGVTRDSLYVHAEKPVVAGKVAYPYPDDVVARIIEYYAYDAENPTDEAKHNFRILGRAGVRTIVYHQLGLDPRNAVPQVWRQFHDRILLDSTPAGYFSVFKESTDLVLDAIKAGLPVDTHAVPDISVGQAWATHWKAKDLAAKCGARGKHAHNYPEYFPHAKSNPQDIDNIYPVEALGDFRRWMQEEYMPLRFPKDIPGEVSDGVLPPSAAVRAEAAQPDARPRDADTWDCRSVSDKGYRQEVITIK
ncbi:MAG TPA: hypothetical protein VF400_10600 [Anaeromyxobacteraceae bacterium]